MAAKPCDTCDHGGDGGIIYGNRLDVCLESFFSLSRSSVMPE